MHNLPDLPDLKLFATVLQAGSLARAARELGLAPSTVSKRLDVLEGRLGVRLMHRTTRRLAVTEDGEAVYRWTQRLLTGIVKLLGESRGLGELDGEQGVAGYAACLMPQTSCHAWKARAARRGSVAGIRWRGRRKRLLI